VLLPSVRCEKTQRGNHGRAAAALGAPHDKQHAALHVGGRAGESAFAALPGLSPLASDSPSREFVPWTSRSALPLLCLWRIHIVREQVGWSSFCTPLYFVLTNVI